MQGLPAGLVEPRRRLVVHGVRGGSLRQRVDGAFVDLTLQRVRKRSLPGERGHELLHEAHRLHSWHVCCRLAHVHARSQLSAVRRRRVHTELFERVQYAPLHSVRGGAVSGQHAAQELRRQFDERRGALGGKGKLTTWTTKMQMMTMNLKKMMKIMMTKKV